MSRRFVIALTVVGAMVALTRPAAADPPRGSTIICYVWASDPSPALNTPYTPSSIYSYNILGRDAANSVVRTATGRYTVTCKGVGGGAIPGTSAAQEVADAAAAAGEPADDKIQEKANSWGAGGQVQVSAYGLEDADYCKVGGWGTGGTDFFVNVGCYDHNGNPSDQRFDMLFVW